MVLVAGWVGYKVNTELFKPGGVMEKLGDHGTDITALKVSKTESDRRIRDLEHWRFKNGGNKD